MSFHTGEGVEKREPSYTIGGNANWYSQYPEQCGEIPLKTGNRTVIWHSNPTAGHTHQGNWNWKRHVYPNVHCSTVYNARTWKTPRCPLADEWIKKLWYIYSYEKECIWVSSNEVDETGAYYTEWNKSERETPIQYTNTYIWNLGRW